MIWRQDVKSVGWLIGPGRGVNNPNPHNPIPTGSRSGGPEFLKGLVP